MREALHAGCATTEQRLGLVSALGWLEYHAVSRWIGMLLEARSPAHRAIGIAASAIHREDPGSALTASIDDADGPLRARSLRAAGELKRRDLLERVRAHVHDAHEDAAFWATWTLTIHRHGSGLPNLVSWLQHESRFHRRAMQLALRALPLEEGQRWISAFAQDPARRASAVLGAGIAGDPTAVPWLIRTMAAPDLARLAGEAFSMITGVDLAYHDLDQDAPPSEQNDDTSLEEVLALTYESNLHWPSPDRIGRWWDANASRFTPGRRYLAGKIIDEDSIRQVLVAGTQRQRAAAALELALMEPDRPLPEVRSRAIYQRERLREWIS
jgi:uncharacterized protein (TIGR02270 family)